MIAATVASLDGRNELIPTSAANATPTPTTDAISGFQNVRNTAGLTSAYLAIKYILKEVAII